MAVPLPVSASRRCDGQRMDASGDHHLEVVACGGNCRGQRSPGPVTSAANNGVFRGVRKGILGPWDAPPPDVGAYGYWDYRGVARPSDIAPFNLDFPLGRYREPRRWTALEEIGLTERTASEHAIVLGPTRSGKTASIIAPWIYHALQLGYSVLAVDVKGRDHLLAEVKRYSSHKGPLGAPVLKWDYTDPRRSVSRQGVPVESAGLVYRLSLIHI